MKQYITGNTLANTVRMAARSRRPKAVFLASDQSDIGLLQAIFSEGECRIIAAHNRENAVQAFRVLVKCGYEGVVTAVNTRFAPANEQDILGEDAGEPKEIVGIEGTWEEVQNQGSMLAGQHVRVTVVDMSAQQANGSSLAIGDHAPNAAMLQALSQIEEIREGMYPKKDKKDYLREARSGAMYGFGDDN